MKKNKVLKKITLLAIMIYIAINCESCGPNQDEELDRRYPFIVSSFIPKYYDDLFKPDVKNKLKLINTYERKAKDTVCNFLYDEKYIIQVYKLSQMYNLSLKNSLTENYRHSEQEVGTIYYANERSRINIFDKMVVSKSDKPSKIFIVLDVTTVPIVAKSDSLIDYFLDFKNLSIKYSNTGSQEVFAEVRQSAEAIPLEILFLKKNKKLYLLLMSPKKDARLLPKMLCKLITPH